MNSTFAADYDIKITATTAIFAPSAAAVSGAADAPHHPRQHHYYSYK
jgi:hypothetical protein